MPNKNFLLISPTYQRLQAKAKDLPQLPKRKRHIIGTGDQSLVLENDAETVYVVTRRHHADKLVRLGELVDLPKTNPPFLIPKMVAFNANLQWLIDPDCSEKNASWMKTNYKLYGALCEQCVVCEMPRCDGSLLDLPYIRFDKNDIKRLEWCLKQTLRNLHAKNITHNDLCAKNILYTCNPKLNFFVADLGSYTVNAPSAHAIKKQRDLRCVKRIIQKAEEILENKERQKKKIMQSLAKFPALMNARLKKIGMSDGGAGIKTPLHDDSTPGTQTPWREDGPRLNVGRENAPGMKTPLYDSTTSSAGSARARRRL